MRRWRLSSYVYAKMTSLAMYQSLNDVRIRRDAASSDERRPACQQARLPIARPVPGFARDGRTRTLPRAIPGLRSQSSERFLSAAERASSTPTPSLVRGGHSCPLSLPSGDIHRWSTGGEGDQTDSWPDRHSAAETATDVTDAARRWWW